MLFRKHHSHASWCFFVRNYPFFMRADFCCKLLAKSHTLTAIMALWHSYILLAGSGCKSRLHYLSAKTLLTVCSLASSRLRRAESGLGADHGASSLITDMGPWSQVSSTHRGPCLHDSHRPGWHPAKTICSQSEERESCIAPMSNRESHFKLVSRVIKQPQSS